VINLDTNVLLAFVYDRSGHDERKLLEGDAWAISDAVLWEIGLLERDERITPLLATADFGGLLDELTVFPVDLRIARALRQLDFRSDPADEIIAATSVVHDIPLLTRDDRILRSKVVPLALRG
jgi:PIN domain nuclease of toxin-antitoxin system